MEHLAFLQDQSISAVIFLKRYLQLEFDNATITCFTWPLLMGHSHDYTHRHPDYRNQLCRLIGQPVTSITEATQGLVISFKNRELLFEKRGPHELLVITDSNGEWHSYPDL